MRKLKEYRHGAWCLVFDSRGFTLVEVMIAGGISTVVLLGLTSMVTNVAKSQQRMAMMADATSLQSLIGMNLANPQACGAQLGEKVFTPGTSGGLTLTAPLVIGGSTLGTTAPNNKYGGWQINSLALTPQNGPVITLNSRNGYNSNLVLDLQNENPMLGTYQKRIQVPLQVIVDPADSNKIKNCYTTNTDNLPANCTAIGGVFDSNLQQCVGPLTSGSALEVAKISAVQNVCASLNSSLGTPVATSNGSNCVFPGGRTFQQYVQDLGSTTTVSTTTSTSTSTSTTTTAPTTTTTSIPPTTTTSTPLYLRNGSCSGTCTASCVNICGVSSPTSCTKNLVGDGAIVNSPTSSLSGGCSPCTSPSTGSCTATCTISNTPI